MQLITGNKFKKISDYILDENGFNKTDNNNSIPIFFIKTDFIVTFFNHYKPNSPFKIITHNSDYPIDNRFSIFLDDENLICWFGQNINFKHKKLISIPIGIANEIWEHGNESIIKNHILDNSEKNNLIYSNFDINTNYYERQKCYNSLIKNNLIMDERINFDNYLPKLKRSYFTLSPNGNGIDCHKLWESMYLKTIPIVTKSINVEFYKDYPLFIINDWDEFNVDNITIELYNDIISRYDENKLNINYYYKLIKEYGKN